MSDLLMDRVIEVRRKPNATYQDVQGLAKLALEEMQIHFGAPGHWPRSAWGPLGGLLDGVWHHPEWHAWARLLPFVFNRFAVWVILNAMGVKKRPGYNDFLIMRWALLGDEETAQELLKQTKREDSAGCTACWALRSLCQQYPEFQARFGGLIPKANPEHMLNDAPASSDPTRLGAE